MKYGLIGEHLTHSFSKIIHEKIGDYVYEIKEIEPNNVDAFMKSKSFNAINVTIPYKQTVIPYLDVIDEGAKKIGAVNTVVNKNGNLYGYNTDIFGMKALINKMDLSLRDKSVLIVGTGGTSKAAYAVAQDMCAKEILFVSRTKKDNAFTYEEIYSSYTHIDVIINTSPVGMFPNGEDSPIDIDKFPSLIAVIDAIYNPIRTSLILNAQSRGINAQGGLYMLISQAVYAYEYFTGKSVDKSLCDDIYNQIENEKINIVLTGMPSSGKTTVGKLLAKKIGKTFVDTDDEIVKKIGMDIPSYFAKYGEAEFRKAESEVIKELSSKNSLIIATGGGAVLNCDNIRRLKQNGRIYFIDRSLENLTPTSDRPLSSDITALKKRYNERYPIYNLTADVVIDGNSTVESVAKMIYGEYIK